MEAKIWNDAISENLQLYKSKVQYNLVIQFLPFKVFTRIGNNLKLNKYEALNNYDVLSNCEFNVQWKKNIFNTCSSYGVLKEDA